MRPTGILGGVAVVLMLYLPAAAQEPMSGPPADHPEQGLEDSVAPTQWSAPEPQGGMDGPRGGMMRHGRRAWPLIRMMLYHRIELGLSAGQVESLENLRGGFMRDAIRRTADRKIARLDLMALLRRDPTDPAKPVDIARVEGKIREIEKMRADFQLERIRTLEAGKAVLTPDQRAKLAGLLAQPRGPRRGPQPPGPARS